MVLAYSLPEPVVSGTVSFGEPGSTAPSDWLRFTNSTGVINGGSTGTTTLMLFYSDIEAGDTNPADVGPPLNLGGNTFACPASPLAPICFTTEGSTGSTEGNNGFDYRPGGVACTATGSCANNQYVGISDVTAAPEPASLALLASGLSAMALLRRRRSGRQG
jgi:hypothetical protein